MKLRNKLLLSTLGLISLATTTSLIATSCTKQTQEDSIAKSYQHEYANDMSMFLDPNEKEILKITRDNKTVAQSYGAFQDLNVQSPTYKGWYLLLRDKSKDNPKEEIIASFCGWNSSYYDKQDTELFKSKTFSIPETIELPSNYSIDGLNTRTLEVRGIGYDNQNKFQGFEKLLNNFISFDKFIENLFFDSELNLSIQQPFFAPNIFLPKKLDLTSTKIRYIFNIAFQGQIIDKNLINTYIIFPESLVYFAWGSLKSDFSKKAIFDFSKTKLIELTYIYISSISTTQPLEESTLSIYLPKTCIRLGRIPFILIDSINLENIIYYGDDTFEGSKFPNNTVKINKNAKYKKSPNNESVKTTFPSNIIIEYF